MAQITSSVGLVSGIDTSSIIDQLMALEKRPVNKLQSRIDANTNQKLAYTELVTRITTINLSAQTLTKASTFANPTAASSNSSVATATAAIGAPAGSYQVQVARMVTSQQSISAGFSDSSTAKIAAGTMTFELGGGEITNSTMLSQLNGGNGIDNGTFRITDSSGSSTTISTSGSITLDDVIKKINTSLDVSVKASVDGDKLVLNDLAGGSGSIAVTDLGSGTSAKDLGISSSAAASTTSSKIVGAQTNKLGRATSLSVLNDGRGIRTTGNTDTDLTITTSNGSSVAVDISSAANLGQVIDSINAAGTGKVTAQISANGKSLQLNDLTGSSGITVADATQSHAATDLGIAGTSSSATLSGKTVLAGINTILLSSLKGGAGLTSGQISITNRNGGNATVDLRSATSVQEILDGINGAGLGVTASINSAGNGIQLQDTTGGTGNLIITDADGANLATALGINGTFDTSKTVVKGANLQRQWISESSALDSLNGGKGIGEGTFSISNASGTATTIDTSDLSTVGDLITLINKQAVGVTASINANGDGLLITDTSGGAGSLKITDTSGLAAKNLRIAGTSSTGSLDGSYETSITFNGTETLTDVQTKINALGYAISASIINDGSNSSQPYRLSLTARNSGLSGRTTIDAGTTGLDTNTLVSAQNAAVFLGDGESGDPLLVQTNSNTLSGIIPNVTLTLTGTSTNPITITITKDAEKAVSTLDKLVTDFNDMVEKISSLSEWDADTNTGGIFLGDSTARSVTDTFYNALLANNKYAGKYTNLASIGITIGEGSKLEFDQDKFNEAYADDPDAVQELFTLLSKVDNGDGTTTTRKDGLAYSITTAVTRLTDSANGIITVENDTLDSESTGFQDRIDSLNDLLDQKRARLERQFAAMESNLSTLQSQSSALSQIGSG